MVGQRRRRRPTIVLALFQRSVYSGYLVMKLGFIHDSCVITAIDEEGLSCWQNIVTSIDCFLILLHDVSLVYHW